MFVSRNVRSNSARFCFAICLALAATTTSPTVGQDEAIPSATGDGVVVATSGEEVVKVGVETLKAGGSAVDAALTVALSQVAQVAGSYVSYAGVLSLIYYDAETGKVYYLNAGFDTPRRETDALLIPAKASGRTALVPGFMAGVEAAHNKFGKLPFARLFEPAVALAEDGIRIAPDLSDWMRQRKDVLARLPETRRIFLKSRDTFYADGDLFRQPELATTLRRVAKDGARFMYTGDWAKHFVEAVQRDGGKISLEDMEAYRAIWEEPLRTTFRENEVFVPGFTSREGVNIVEALNLLELADLKKRGNYSKSPESLFWLCQILSCQDLMWLPSDKAGNKYDMDLSPTARVSKKTAEAIWERMQKGTWRYARQLVKPNSGHSDAVVVVDRWGNVAALTHTINTSLWGETGIFVDGVSIPDSASIQRQQVYEIGPGKRLPDTIGPLLVLREGKPVFVSSAIGSGLHEKTVQVLLNILEFGMDPQDAIEAPYLLPRKQGAKGPVARVIEGTFDMKLIDKLQTLGQPAMILPKADIAEWGNWRCLLVGIQLDPKTGARRGVPLRYSATVPKPYVPNR
jgi:gamma-glutamyltranspeptidase / glutathione hydrolase